MARCSGRTVTQPVDASAIDGSNAQRAIARAIRRRGGVVTTPSSGFPGFERSCIELCPSSEIRPETSGETQGVTLRVRIEQNHLHRLEAKGWISASWERSEMGKRARFYSLTSRGKKELSVEQIKWETFARAMGLVLS